MPTVGDRIRVLVLLGGLTSCTSTTEATAPTAEEQITRAAGPSLGLASLRVTVRDVAGAPLVPSISIAGETITTTDDAAIAVPVGRQRVRVSVDGLGGFVEDIDFTAHAHIERDLVLAPGPDMVRIAGGAFVLGPPAHYLSEQVETADGETMRHPFAALPRRSVTIATFDLDRSEVTAAQYAACRKAAKTPYCDDEPRCAGAEGCPHRAFRRPADPRADVLPPDSLVPLCNVRPPKDDLAIPPGRENHPANCIDRFEAEDYCRWVGKRLPTDAEWEFAARSRNPEYDCPFADGRQACETHLAAPPIGDPHGPRTAPVCSSPAGNSEQGVCDLMANVEEFVATPGHCRGQSWAHGSTTAFREQQCGDYQRDPAVGFRCARDVAEPETSAR